MTAAFNHDAERNPHRVNAHTDPDDGPVLLDSEPLLSVTMTPSAAERFRRALLYADAIVFNAAEANDAPDAKAKIQEHGDWLRWGCARIDHATREAK